MSQSQSQSRASPKPSLKSPRVGAPKEEAKEQAKEQAQSTKQIHGRGELGLLPSPAFDITVPDRNRTGSPKTVEFDESAVQAQDQEDVGESIGHEQDPAGLEFQPFFTLITDGVTAEHYHPTVHYVFSDDQEGEELVSEGVLRALGADGGRHEEMQTLKQREHVLILDVDVKNPASVAGESVGASYEVVQAQSLSAVWQVNSVEITSAPTISQGENKEEGDGGFMLRIEGRGLLGDDTGVEIGTEGLESLLGKYERGLVEIRRIAGLKFGDGGRDV
jgi:hypothetical protein